MTIPYFYIIREVDTGILYAGCRRKDSCNPDELLKVGGYTTSSPIVNEIINIKGLSAFEVIKIDTVCDNMNVYDYETKFLVENDCAGSPLWYNGHNNKLVCFHTEEYKKIMNKLYGCDHPMNSSQIVNKLNNTNKERYGVGWYTQSPDFAHKVKQTLLEKYGVDHNMKSPEVREKAKRKMFERFGVEYYTQTDDFKNKISKIQHERTQEEKQQIVLKKEEAMKKKFGVGYFAQTEQGLKISSINMSKANSLVRECQFCNKIVKGPNYKRWHGMNCKVNPTCVKVRSHRKQPCIYCKKEISVNMINVHQLKCSNHINRDFNQLDTTANSVSNIT